MITPRLSGKTLRDDGSLRKRSLVKTRNVPFLRHVFNAPDPAPFFYAGGRERRNMKREIRMEPLTRNLVIRAGDIALDTQNRSVELSFSSDTAVDMWFGKEILSHKAGSMRKGSRAVNLPLLFNHAMDDLLGVVESIRIDSAAGKGFAVVRFGKDERGEWAMQQCADGVLTNVSFMYRVYKYTEDVETETYTALDWEVLEISLVTVPADPNVGVGRSEPMGKSTVQIISEGNSTMLENTENLSRSQRAAARSAADADIAIATRAAKNERERVMEIRAMCESQGVAELANPMIENGTSIGDARTAVLERKLAKVGTQHAINADSDFDGYIGMNNQQARGYSIRKAICAAISGDWKDAGLEREMHQELCRKTGKETMGILIPTDVMSARSVGYMGSGDGGNLIATNLMADAFIDVLRKKARVLQMGATVLSGLVGNVDIPRQTSVTETSWISESDDLTQAEGSFDKITLSPKHIGTYSMYSRNMLLQSTPDIEMLIRNDLIQQIALGIDRAALNGTGSANEPLGIMGLIGIGHVIGGSAGAAITFDHLVDMIAAVSRANADGSSMGFLANAKTISALQKLKSTTGQYLWNAAGGSSENYSGANAITGARASGNVGEYSFNGHPVGVTNQLRSDLTKGGATGLSELVLGNWSDLIIGNWGVLEILPNPYDAVAYKKGAVLIRALQSVDIGIRHPESFAVMSDAITS